MLPFRTLIEYLWQRTYVFLFQTCFQNIREFYTLIATYLFAGVTSVACSDRTWVVTQLRLHVIFRNSGILGEYIET
jgi:hypothetical protein